MRKMLTLAVLSTAVVGLAACSGGSSGSPSAIPAVSSDSGGRASLSGGRASLSGGRASLSGGRASLSGGRASLSGGRASL